MKLMLPLPPYHTIYLIIKLFQINLMFIRFEDYSIFIGPFIDTLSTTSWISNILTTGLPTKYHNKTHVLPNITNLASVSNPNFLEIFHP
jgi:hypothetical protein